MQGFTVVLLEELGLGRGGGEGTPLLLPTISNPPLLPINFYLVNYLLDHGNDAVGLEKLDDQLRLLGRSCILDAGDLQQRIYRLCLQEQGLFSAIFFCEISPFLAYYVLNGFYEGD